MSLTRRRTPRILGSLAILVFVLAGCSTRPPAFGRRASRTCLVLSVGGTRGMAHAGAVDALVESGLHFDCVYGNSAGALVGAVLAASPREPVTPRMQRLLVGNVDAGHQQASERAFGGALVGLLFGPVGALVGGAAGAASTPRVHLGRAVGVLDQQLGGVRIEDLPIAYRSSHYVRNDEGVDFVEDSHGNLASAVGRSVANPFIFEDVGVVEVGGAIDPGVDRVSAVPVFDACRAFPDAALVVLNATDHEPFEHGVTCERLMISLPDLSTVELEGVMTGGSAFELAAAFGRTAVLERLGTLPRVPTGRVVARYPAAERVGEYAVDLGSVVVDLRAVRDSGRLRVEYRSPGKGWWPLRSTSELAQTTVLHAGAFVVVEMVDGKRSLVVHEWRDGFLVPVLAWAGALGASAAWE